MEADKRKRTADGEFHGKRTKPREDDAAKMATEDEEVEEFFAILRLIHVAVKYFEKRNDVAGRELTAWRPSFQWEDFEDVNGVKDPGSREKSGYLDLNADPETKRETVSIARGINN